MYEYTPFYSPKITVEYDITDEGQRETKDSPEYPLEIEITAVKIHNQEIDEYLQSHILETHEKQWIREIIDQIKNREAVA